MDLDDYICTGYFITHYNNRPDYNDPTLLPPKILSLSPCLANFFPDSWCYDWVQMDENQRYEKANIFGIDQENLEKTIHSLTNRFNKTFGYSNVCFSLTIAQNLVNEFIFTKSDLTILGASIPRSMKKQFCSFMTPPPPEKGFAPIGHSGLLEMVIKNEPPRMGTKILGFELLNFDHYIPACSWLCNSLEQKLKNKFNIKPNHNGFIDNIDDAFRACELISNKELKAEPGLWQPMLITQYSLS